MIKVGEKGREGQGIIVKLNKKQREVNNVYCTRKNERKIAETIFSRGMKQHPLYLDKKLKMVKRSKGKLMEFT